ncbi:MAG: SgcJ/EcaC family oxidoreductase [Schlesneria sp.]
MSINRGIVVASIVIIAFGSGFAHAQGRDKQVDTAVDLIKQRDAAGGVAPELVKKRIQLVPKVDVGNKPADTVKKPAIARGATIPDDAEERAIRASAAAFTKFYNAHDSKGLASLFSPKAEMIDENDSVVKGREKIEEAFAKVFKNFPDASMEVDITSIRVLTPMLAIEEGSARSKDSKDDPEDSTVYVAIHVKVDGNWQLACVRDWNAPAAALTPHDHLERDLSWLVGEWIQEGPDSVVHTVCRWHDNGNFLMQEFKVNVAGQIAMSGTVRIGWNAVTKQFQSWIFDSHGGHSTGFWVNAGDRWIVKMQGATANGETGSSTNYYRPIDADTTAWGSIDRIIDGEPIEDINEIIVKRRPPLPAE